MVIKVYAIILNLYSTSGDPLYAILPNLYNILLKLYVSFAIIQDLYSIILKLYPVLLNF